ncbi:hypothetical protein EQO05_01005 [Methanosarcina sp. MSH10X1]|uniref:DUF5906 domain-containing protein n=1 Tax=Methanosarcina sp. MSH10X1 TaxID=2507075 RepID=UPI000FFB55FD|nr:DUF5906 domain-containing protein [Methanosarcina sp. MSH10X1]RXA21847.1 hypothetical protein EQO05_01005 [Methanosarcina sp. MSH10X1]
MAENNGKIENFDSLADIVKYASDNVELGEIEFFVRSECAKLPCKVAEDDLADIIETLESTVKEIRGKTIEDYEIMLKEINPEPRIADVKKFIKANMLEEKKEFIDEFILESLKDKEKFGFKNDEIKNIKDFVKYEKRAYDKEKAKKTKAAVSKNKEGKYDAIDLEFDGLYTAEVMEATDKIIIIPHIDEIAYRVIENVHVIMHNRNIFCFSEGCYKNNAVIAEAEAARILNGICKGTRSNGISTHLKDVMTIIKNTNPVEEYPFNKHNNAIPVKNGVVVIDFEKKTITKEEHDPAKWKFNYVLPVVYNEKAVNDTIINELKKYTPDYKMLVQAVAQSLLQAMGYGPYKKAYLLKGGKNCGKTTFLDITEEIVGKNNKSKVALNELTPSHQFSRGGMEGKLVNIDDDLGYFKMSETGIFKKLTGGFSQKIEKKGIDPYDVNITSVHIFTTNTPAGFDNRIYVDDAFWGRWLYIEFEHVFEIDDDFKKRTLTEENISAFFNSIIQMVIEIRCMKHLLYEQKWTEVREKWTRESNILCKFVEENMVLGGRTAIIKEDLMAAITKYCYDRRVDNNIIPTSINALGDLVEVCGGSRDAQRTFKNSDGRVNHCFILNYMWKSGSEYKVYAREEKAQDIEDTIKKIKDNNNLPSVAGC